MALEDKMARLGQTLVSTSEEMKLKLKEQYLPVEYEQIMYNKLLQLKQGSHTILWKNRLRRSSWSATAFQSQSTRSRYRGLKQRLDIQSEMASTRL